MRIPQTFWKRAVFPERPKLYCHPDGRWRVRVAMIFNSNLICMHYRNLTGRLEVGLTKPFKEWLDRNDPEHRTWVSDTTTMIVEFSDENMAMLFRMTYDAWVIYE